jgi:hypothetical protein
MTRRAPSTHQFEVDLEFSGNDRMINTPRAVDRNGGELQRPLILVVTFVTAFFTCLRLGDLMPSNVNTREAASYPYNVVFSNSFHLIHVGTVFLTL